MEREEITYIQQAIEQAKIGKTPFGALILQEGTLLSASYNTVGQHCDPTAHAEMNAIREACQSVQASRLKNAILYTTCEPCPMCITAALYAGIQKVVYGAPIPLIARYLPQIPVRASEIIEQADQNLELIELTDQEVFESLLREYS